MLSEKKKEADTKCGFVFLRAKAGDIEKRRKKKLTGIKLFSNFIKMNI
jgi:hypothetical protein